MSIPLNVYEGESTRLEMIVPKEGNILVCKDTRQVFADLNMDGVLTRLQLGTIKVSEGNYVDVKTYIDERPQVQLIAWEDDE